MTIKRFAKQAIKVSPLTKRKRSLKKTIVWMLLTVIGIFATSAITLWWSWDAPLTSPLNQFTNFQFVRHPIFNKTSKKQVYGFLPYWNIKNLKLHKEITQVGYFGLTIGADGNILTVVDGETDPGYRILQSETFLNVTNQVIANGGQIELVLKQFNADDINTFVNSKKARATFLSSLESILLAYDVSGINIDIELNGESSPQLRHNFTLLIKELDQFLNKRFGDIQLSIDVYASAAKGGQLWDIPALEPNLDYFIIMAYDFHRSNSIQAGPVAPLLGGSKYWDSDINSHLKEFLQVVPSKKLLLGIPFYGYEWQTTSTEAQSQTFPDTGQAVVYKRIQELLSGEAGYEVTEYWNEEALSPYLTYTITTDQGEETFMLYYDNARSIAYKLDYVNQLDLGGIAIWALGYEGENEELWQVIKSKL